MKYSSEYINSLSFSEYLKLMAYELDSNGFKAYGKYDYKVDEESPAMMRRPSQ